MQRPAVVASAFAISVLPFVGMFISGILTVSHLWGIAVPCLSGNECNAIAYSRAASLFGIPIALFGFLSYVALAVLSSVAQSARSRAWRKRAFNASYLIVALSTAISALLTLYSLRVLGKVCLWCAGSAMVFSAILLCHTVLAEKRTFACPSTLEPNRAVWMRTAAYFIIVVLALVSMAKREVLSIELVDARIASQLPAATLQGTDRQLLGERDAPVKLVVFSDYGCPLCKALHKKLRKYARDGVVSVTMRHYTFGERGVRLTAAVLAQVAAENGKFWEFTDKCFELDRLTTESLVETFVNIGVNKEVLGKLNVGRAEARVAEDLGVAAKVRIVGTPVIFVLRGESFQHLTPTELDYIVTERNYN